MAARLLQAGFPDGAVFHGYHAYECAISAFIAAGGYEVPPEGWQKKLALASGKTVAAYPSPGGGIEERPAHRARLLFFDKLADRTKPYFTTHAALSRFITLGDRNAALYYDAVNDRLPQETYQRAFAIGLIPVVRQFARDIWREVR